MENQVKLCSSGDTTAVILIKTTPDLTIITLKELLLDRKTHKRSIRRPKTVCDSNVWIILNRWKQGFIGFIGIADVFYCAF